MALGDPAVVLRLSSLQRGGPTRAGPPRGPGDGRLGGHHLSRGSGRCSSDGARIRIPPALLLAARHPSLRQAPHAARGGCRPRAGRPPRTPVRGVVREDEAGGGLDTRPVRYLGRCRRREGGNFHRHVTRGAGGQCAGGRGDAQGVQRPARARHSWIAAWSPCSPTIPAAY